MINIETRNSKPIYEQIIDQMKYNVLKGYLKPGDSIMSVRRLALELDITPGTVAKAYQELERQKVIVTLRGKGTFIADNDRTYIDNERLDDIKKNINTSCVELAYMGYSKEDIVDMIYEFFSNSDLDATSK